MTSPAGSPGFRCPKCRHEFQPDVVTDVEAVVCPDCGMSVPSPRFEELKSVAGLPVKGSGEDAEPSTRPFETVVEQGPAAEDSTGQAAVRRDPSGSTRPRPVYVAGDSLPAWKLFGQWCFRICFESRTGMLVLLGVVGVSGITTWGIWNHSEFQRHEALVNSAWDEADVAFRQAQFNVAGKAYQRVIQRSGDWGRSGWLHTRLAGHMQDLVEQAEKVDAVLENEASPLAEELFVELKRSLAELLGQEPVPAVRTDRPDAGGDGLPVGLDFTPAGRAGELLDGWLVSRAERMAARLTAALVPETAAVDRLEEFSRRLTQWQRDTAGLESACRKGRIRIEQAALAVEFKIASDAVLENYSSDAVRTAYRRWQALESAGGGDGAKISWTAFVENLRSKLKSEARVPLDGEPEPEGGRPVAEGPPVIELPPGTTKPIGDGDQVVYVNDEDRLLALDAETGSVGWAVRRGFGNGWLPVRGRVNGSPVSVVSWRQEQRVYLSVLKSQSGTALWTRRMPVDGEELWQAPIVHESSVLVSNQKGLVLQLDLANGETRSRVRLPEALATACVLNSRDNRLACLGQQLGAYIIGLSPTLSVEDVYVRDGSVDIGEAYAMWIDSVLLVLVNRPDSRCTVSAYRMDNGQLIHSGEDIELDGHLWQQPPVLGDSVFLATDSGQLAKLVVSPDSQRQPVRLAWSDEGDAKQLGTRPYVLAHAEAPLLLGFGGTVTASFLAMGENKNDRGLKTAWKWVVPGEGQVVCQPLLVCSKGVVIAIREPDKAEVFVECLDITSGRRRWRWASGGTPRPAGKTPRAAADRRPWSLVVGHFYPLRSLDPWNASLPLEREVVPLLFDRLLQPALDGARYIKGTLLTGYEVLPGTRRSPAGAACQAFRLHLAGSRVFHDGSRLGAVDVVESIRRLGSARVQWHQREQSRMLRSPKRLQAGQVEVLVRPYLASRSLLNVYIAPHSHYAKIPKAGTALSSVPVGSGRFQVVNRSGLKEVVLRRSRHHPSSRPGVAGVQDMVFRRFAVSDLDEMVRQWREGRLDMIAGLGTAELAALRASGVDGAVRTVSSRRVAVLMINQRQSPFDVLGHRHKLARLLGMRFRREVLKTVGEVDGGAIGVDSVFPRLSIGDSHSELPALADALFGPYLAELERAKGGQPLSLKIEAGNWLAEKGAAAIADRLSSKVNVKLVRLSGRQFQAEVREGRSFELAICVLDYSDPLLHLGGLLDTRTSDGGVPSLNPFGFHGQSLMQSIVDFRDARDWADVRIARRRLDEVIRDHAVVIPLWTDPQFAIFSKSIRIPPAPVKRSPGPWLFHRLAEWKRAT